VIKMAQADLASIVDAMVLGYHPEGLHPTAWVAHRAVLTGQVHLGPEASVWYGAVLRGDLAPIRIGARTSIQDGVIVHVDYEMPTLIGCEVVVGHGAVIHAATVGEGCLIGIRAAVLSEAEIGQESIVGAGSVIREGERIPARSLVVGVPGRVVRQVSDDEAAAVRALAARYVAYARRYRAGLQEA